MTTADLATATGEVCGPPARALGIRGNRVGTKRACWTALHYTILQAQGLRLYPQPLGPFSTQV